MEKDFIEIKYPAIFTTKENGEVVIKLLRFQKMFRGEDKAEAVTKAKRFLLKEIIEFKNKGKTAKEFMRFYPADSVNELSLYLESGDKIEHLSDEFYDELNEFEEFTMYFINRLEASNNEAKSDEELVMEQLKAIREARQFAEENGVPIIAVSEEGEANE